MIDIQAIKERFLSPETTKFYGYMYGNPTKTVITGTGSLEVPDEIIEIHKDGSVQAHPDDDYFYFVWGWPGPDYNKYYYKDYGTTWAFTREEIK